MNQTRFQRYSVALVAGVDYMLNTGPATTVYCTMSTAAFTIAPDNRDVCDIEQGVGFRYLQDDINKDQDETFTKLRLRSATTQNVVLYVGSGIIDDNRLIGNVDISGGIRIQAYSGMAIGEHAVGTTITTLVSSAAGIRRKLTVKNIGSATVWLCSNSGQTPANGFPIEPGESIVMETNFIVRIISAVAGQLVRYIIETDV